MLKMVRLPVSSLLPRCLYLLCLLVFMIFTLFSLFLLKLLYLYYLPFLLHLSTIYILDSFLFLSLVGVVSSFFTSFSSTFFVAVLAAAFGVPPAGKHAFFQSVTSFLLTSTTFLLVANLFLRFPTDKPSWDVYKLINFHSI